MCMHMSQVAIMPAVLSQEEPSIPEMTTGAKEAMGVTLKQGQLVVQKATTLVPITVVRTGGSGMPLSVTLTTKEGSATYGRDFL